MQARPRSNATTAFATLDASATHQQAAPATNLPAASTDPTVRVATADAKQHIIAFATIKVDRDKIANIRAAFANQRRLAIYPTREMAVNKANAAGAIGDISAILTIRVPTALITTNTFTAEELTIVSTNDPRGKQPTSAHNLLTTDIGLDHTFLKVPFLNVSNHGIEIIAASVNEKQYHFNSDTQVNEYHKLFYQDELLTNHKRVEKILLHYLGDNKVSSITRRISTAISKPKHEQQAREFIAFLSTPPTPDDKAIICHAQRLQHALSAEDLKGNFAKVLQVIIFNLQNGNDAFMAVFKQNTVRALDELNSTAVLIRALNANGVAEDMHTAILNYHDMPKLPEVPVVLNMLIADFVVSPDPQTPPAADPEQTVNHDAVLVDTNPARGPKPS